MPHATSYTDLKEMGATSILLVEGVDDWHCIHWLLDKFYPEFEAHSHLAYCGNKEKVLKALAAETIAANPLSRLGAIIDTDDSSLASILQSLSNAIGTDYPLPKRFPKTGLIKNWNSSRPPTIGLWCMPDNRTQGVFEDLLNRAMPVPAGQFIEKTIEEAVEAAHAKHRDVERPKAILRTYMAWNAPTCSKYGEALNNNLIPKDALEPHFRLMIDWARRLFE